jgi:hypothetical protein
MIRMLLLMAKRDVFQAAMFQNQLNGDAIGFSVLGIFVINKQTILSVRFQSSVLFQTASRLAGVHHKSMRLFGIGIDLLKAYL